MGKGSCTLVGSTSALVIPVDYTRGYRHHAESAIHFQCQCHPNRRWSRTLLLFLLDCIDSLSCFVCFQLQVEEALLAIIAQHSGKGVAGAAAYLDALKAQERYQRDVWF